MTIENMISNARKFAAENGEAIDAYWAEYPRVMKLLVAYYGGFNLASDMSNYNRIRS